MGSLYGETDDDTAIKTEMVLKAGMNAMLCIGELLEERKNGTTIDVCARQLSAVIPRISDWSRVVIAYEPVWAIGTGVVATPLQAQEAHYQIQQLCCCCKRPYGVWWFSKPGQLQRTWFAP